MPAPSEMTPESRERSNGRLAVSGSEFLRELRPEAMKLAMAKGVIGASAPPAIAKSASPDRIIAAAIAIASNPDGQAEETVVAWAQAPIRSAIMLAAAWGFEAPSAVGLTRSGPGPLTSWNTFSITSRALVLTPITTGVGLGSWRLFRSRPASSRAIMAAA